MYLNNQSIENPISNILSNYYSRTDIPIQLIEFPDYPFTQGTSSFPSHFEMQKYYESYAEHFDVIQHIRFNHSVIRVCPVNNNRWEVIVKDMASKKYETVIYDAVFVCNGSFSKPYIPVISGAEDFRGKTLHSRHFRSADEFRGMCFLHLSYITSEHA